MVFFRKLFPYREYNIVFILIGINILVYLGERFLSNGFLIWIKYSMNPKDIKNGHYWQFVTYMFVHDPRDLWHLFFNMFGLFIFGTRVERNLGSIEFIFFYFITGTLAGVFSFFVNMNTPMLLMGASGALYAVMLAYAIMFPRSVIYIWGIIPLRAPILVLGYTALQIVYMVTGANSGVAHFTHLAGFVLAWIYFMIRFGINPWSAMRRP